MLKGGFWGPGTPVASPPVPGNSLRVQGNLVSFNVMYHIDVFACVDPSFHPRNKFYLVIENDPLNVLLNLVC